MLNNAGMGDKFMKVEIPFGGWFGANDKGEVIALCFKQALSEEQLNFLQEWWARYVGNKR